jgi:hypothetical protein
MEITNDSPEFKKFRKLVRKMRKTQRNYWASRNLDNIRQLLTEMHAAELAIDQAMRQLNKRK